MQKSFEFRVVLSTLRVLGRSAAIVAILRRLFRPCKTAKLLSGVGCADTLIYDTNTHKPELTITNRLEPLGFLD